MIFLPLYSPNLNLIEQAFLPVKAYIYRHCIEESIPSSYLFRNALLTSTIIHKASEDTLWLRIAVLII
jgi:transposase